MPHTGVLVWGRRTGKTEGPGCDFTLHNILSMPRSNGLIQGSTYEQILTRTLPPLIAAWESMGYRENEHFWVRRFADKKLKIDKAYRYPTDPMHYIQWFNGSGIYLVSQDRPGTSNGVASQWQKTDEFKFINYKKYKEESSLTLSGMADKFGHMSCYRSRLFMSDMPTHPSGNWCFEFEKLMQKGDVESIIWLQVKIMELQQKLDTVQPNSRIVYLATIKKYLKEIEILRKGLVYYNEASTIDNIHVLGLDTILDFIRDLNKHELMASVLGKRITMDANSFYINLDHEFHGYFSSDYSFIDSLEINHREQEIKDCRWDGDIDKALPLQISCDYNNAINCIVTGQSGALENKFLSNKFVKQPLLLKDCVDLWHEYYKYHSIKELYYIYDHTAIGKRADSNDSFADQWIKYLRLKGWIVIPVYLGQSPSHKVRYNLFNTVFRCRDKSAIQPFKYNKNNCSSWAISCFNAPVEKRNNEIKKVKKSENNPHIPPEEATHLSEAGDMLLYYWYKDLLSASHGVFVDAVG